MRARWLALTGQPAPLTFRAPLLRAAVAYKLQEQVHGGLKPSTCRLLHRVAVAAERHAPELDQGTVASTPIGPTLAGTPIASVGQADDLGPMQVSSTLDVVQTREPEPASALLGLATPVKAAFATAARRRLPQAPVRIKPGMRLLRTWQGSTHEVLVGDNGVTYRGQSYRSLSEVARLITGQRWSGPLFFGLKRRAPLDPEPNARPMPERGRGHADHG